MNDPAAARPYWLYCFNVEDIDAAAARIVASSGESADEPARSAGRRVVARAQDPRGAVRRRRAEEMAPGAPAYQGSSEPSYIQ